MAAANGTAAGAGIAGSNELFAGGFLKDVYNQNPSQNVITRFPPEPNGYLHLGHSKAIAVNFGFARYHGGQCYLRFDDTNPEAEEEEYFVAIEEIIRWLGFTPIRVTSSSDNFQKLYDLAEFLIEKDGAYVCHCTSEEVKAGRGVVAGGKGGERYGCKHRDRPPSESLAEFRAMRDGKYSPGEAVLRMKQDMNSPNPQMWDLAAYRIPKPDETTGKPRPHHRTGLDWRIYPTYDYTHCLCDSFEGITHSMCTVEFENSRESYEWLCDKVEVYKPMQREYGRLNLEGTVLSKRKLQLLVQGGQVRGWNDPRLYTLIALKRRGVPPGAILSFVNGVGVTKANSSIETAKFEQDTRKYLETTVPRLMVIPDPIPVIIDSLPDDYLEMVDVDFPNDPNTESRKLPFTRKVYIDRSDFREVDSKDYKRLAPGKDVGLLKVAFPIVATSFSKDEQGLVTEIHAEAVKPDAEGKIKKPKAYIQWVADSSAHSSPIRAEIRNYNRLFTMNDPGDHPDGFLAAINPDSEEIYPHAMIETGFHEIQRRSPWPALEGEKKFEGETAPPETVRFQALRVGYYCVDVDSKQDKLVLNRIVSLKEDVAKEPAAAKAPKAESSKKKQPKKEKAPKKEGLKTELPDRSKKEA